MPPQFRTDLKAQREEQQGVVFYRVDDPTAQTSFRLYEIEYLIASRLNGSRELADVIEAVKAEYNFDITPQDLAKFVAQLQSMGFIVGDVGDEASGTVREAAMGADTEETHVMPPPPPTAAEPTPSAATVDTPTPQVASLAGKRPPAVRSGAPLGRLVVLLIVTLGIYGGWSFMEGMLDRWLPGGPRVATFPLVGHKVLVDAPGTVVTLGAAQERWLAFAAPGVVKGLLSQGAPVAAGARIGALALPSGMDKQIAAAEAVLRQLTARQEKQGQELAAILGEREAALASRTDLQTKLKALAAPKTRPAAKLRSEQKKLQQEIAKINRKLSVLARQERRAHAALGATKRASEAPGRKLAAWQEITAPKTLTAPFPGVLAEVRAKSGDTVSKAQPIVLLRDVGAVNVDVDLPKGSAAPAVGAAVQFASGDALHVGKILSVTNAGGTQRLTVRLPDDKGTLAAQAPASLRVVAGTVVAYTMPAAALIDSGVAIVVEGRVSRVPVRILRRDGETVTVSGDRLQDGASLIVERVAEFAEGALVRAE